MPASPAPRAAAPTIHGNPVLRTAPNGPMTGSLGKYPPPTVNATGMRMTTEKAERIARMRTPISAEHVGEERRDDRLVQLRGIAVRVAIEAVVHERDHDELAAGGTAREALA